MATARGMVRRLRSMLQPNTPVPRPSLFVPAERPHHQLRYTGQLDRAGFEAKCAEHGYWYHSYYFDNGFVQRGDYDIGHGVADYGFPDDLSGLSVLDIGTGSGWFATYFEQQGADVTVTDARGTCDFDIFGRDRYPDVTTEKPSPDRCRADGRPVYYSPVSKGFWLMKEILGLRAEYVNARVYEICPELFGGRKFDLVFMGSILMHLRDPIGALMAAHSVCKRQLIATSYLRPDIPGSALPYMGMEERAVDGISWWAPNRAGLVQWLKGAGFTTCDLDRKVRLTVDQAYRDSRGHASAVDQIQVLVQAFV